MVVWTNYVMGARLTLNLGCRYINHKIGYERLALTYVSSMMRKGKVAAQVDFNIEQI